MFTPQELSQYARLTFKQYGLEDYSLVFLPQLTRRLGQANPWEKRIELSFKCLDSFKLFDLVFKHELAHILDFIERGAFKNKNGRNDFHGKNFKTWCKKLRISHSTHI